MRLQIAVRPDHEIRRVHLALSRPLGCQALIVMPVTTPSIKVQAVQDRGAQVVLHGDSYDAAYEHAIRRAAEDGLTFVHPYDDPEVIAGQGTIGMEILRQHAGPLHAIFVPIGGGGLVSGIAAYVKRLRPDTRIVGVEPMDADEESDATATDDELWPFQMLDDLEWVLRELGHEEDERAA